MVVIQWPRRRLGMKLNSQHRQLSVREPLDRAVIEVDETHLPPGANRHGCRINLEPMILRGNRHPPGSQVSHRVVATSMAELQFSCLGADRPRQQLVTQTNAKVRNLLLYDTSDDRQSSIEVGRVTRTG